MGARFKTLCIFIISGIILIGNLSAQTVRSRDTKKDKLLQDYYDRLEKEKTGEKSDQYLNPEDKIGNARYPDYRSPKFYADSLKKSRQTPDSLMKMPPDSLLPDSLLDSLYLQEQGMADSLADTLVPFGYDMFELTPEQAMPSEVADIESYLLGPGDNIYLFLWGKVEQEYDLTIDREGKVFIPKIGEVMAWGMTINEFEKKVKARLSKVYSDFNLSVSLGKIRSIRVYLTGEVKNPGAYTVSSLVSLFNAMYLAGGPSPRGSMRNVRLIRNGKVEKTVDLYNFLLQGTSEGDVQLSSGDAVFVPVTGPKVAIDGEINRPAIYEIKEGETVSDLLEMAGGPTAKAYLDHVMIDRISKNNDRVILDANMNPETGPIDNMPLRNGDSVYVAINFEMKYNYVSIAGRGVVKHPGYYEWTDSMTVKDLLDIGELAPRNVYYERANLIRKYPDLSKEVIAINLNDIISGKDTVYIRNLDSLHIYRYNQINPDRYVYIEGAVKNPGEFLLYNDMTVNDLIFLAGDFTKNAYGLNIELARPDSLGVVNTYQFDRNNPEIRNFRLMENDYVFVRERPDLFLHQLVTVEGEVRFPGQYALLSRNETLYDLIRRAGGFTNRAFPKGIIFYRESIGESLIRQNLPSIIERSAPVREDSVGNLKRLEFIKFSPDNVNRIIIDMESLLKSEGKKGDIKLRSEDYVYVPRIPSGISVLGAVGAEGTIKFESGKKVKHYIQLAGNYSRNADKGGIKLIKADGQVLSGGSTIRKKVELGDAIVVPTEIKREKDWLKTMSTVFSVVAGALTTILVIDRL